MKISFFLRDSKLQTRVALNGNYLRLTTGIKVPAHIKFNASKQRFTGTSMEVAVLNEKMQKHKNFLTSFKDNTADIKKEYESFINPKIAYAETVTEGYDIESLCNAYYKGIATGTILSKKGSKIKSSTVDTYYYTIKTIISYAKTAPKINILDFNLSVVKDLDTKRQLVKEWDSWILGFHDFLRNKAEYKANTMATITNVLAIIINHYESHLFIQLPKVKVVLGHEVPIVVLDPEFIKRFTTDKRYTALYGRDRFTWEVCATILITSMRISDAVDLNWKNLVERPDGLFLNKWNKKTGATSNMLLPNILASIFRDNMAIHGSIYTPIKGDKVQTMYRHMPTIFAMYDELNKEVSTSVMNKNGDMEVITKPLHKWITPHMLRKTAITSMLANGISQTHVKFASGHKHNSIAFHRYVGFVERNFTNELNQYYGNL